MLFLCIFGSLSRKTFFPIHQSCNQLKRETIAFDGFLAFVRLTILFVIVRQLKRQLITTGASVRSFSTPTSAPECLSRSRHDELLFFSSFRPEALFRCSIKSIIRRRNLMSGDISVHRSHTEKMFTKRNQRMFHRQANAEKEEKPGPEQRDHRALILRHATISALSSSYSESLFFGFINRN